MVTKQQHFGALDSLRGIASLLVVLYHLPAWYLPFYQLAWIRNGYLMVNFFFVLSGFVLFYSYADRLKTREQALSFVALRFGRIYPVHLVFLVAFLGTEVAKYLASARGLSSGGAAFTENSPGAFVECLFLVQALGFSTHEATFNFPSWSISTEFYTYLLFAGAVLLLGKRQLVIASALAFLGTLGLLVFAHGPLGTFQSWVRCICGFFLGCVVGQLYQHYRARSYSVVLPLLAVGLLLVLLQLGHHGSETEIVFPISAAVVLAFALVPEGGLGSLLLWKPLRWLGEISYSLYMCHALVLWVARQGCRVVLKAPEVLVEGGAAAQLSTPVAIAISSASVLASVGLAWLSFRFIEDPWRNRARTAVDAWRQRARASLEVPTLRRQ